MSAPITKQHLKIVDEIRVGDRSMRFDITDAQAAQLIADSEAKACAQLRAEVERLKRDYDYDHKCLHEVRERCELWKQRAERAEAELKKWSLLNLWGGTPEIIHAFIKGQQNRICAAEKAEAELAAERARLDWLLSRMGGNVLPVNGCVAWTVDVYHYKNQFPSRAAIDAAMKEGA